jgi:hypothetical protein
LLFILFYFRSVKSSQTKMNQLHHKKVAAIKSLPHPKDRKVDQLQRKLRREVRLDSQKDHLNSKQALVASRFFWFRDQVQAIVAADPSRKVNGFTDDEVAALASLNVDRNNDEVAELKTLRNPPAGRIKHLNNMRQSELDQLNSVKGITVPDLSKGECLDILLDVWDGDDRTITCVPLSQCSKVGKNVADALSKFQAVIRSTHEVREEQLNLHAPSKLRRFTSEGTEAKARKNLTKTREERKKSVKVGKASGEVAESGRKRRVLQQQSRTKIRRQAAVAASRGLM